MLIEPHHVRSANNADVVDRQRVVREGKPASSTVGVYEVTHRIRVDFLSIARQVAGLVVSPELELRKRETSSQNSAHVMTFSTARINTTPMNIERTKLAVALFEQSTCRRARRAIGGTDRGLGRSFHCD